MYPTVLKYSSPSFNPTHAMMMNAASTSVGYYCTSEMS
jgi:hypothetical protein